MRSRSRNFEADKDNCKNIGLLFRSGECDMPNLIE